ncbi:MAG: hypothetical protein CVU55_07650 [Deltaproteobacteria bacterium HGW-Deltaproteobacteria-13]|jgi:hypothetical protein|nr:MAG: hypothetical protein CVU55_07650 [Deltaproteobacteria bacterium HGW-Deltaproteobacteria-13]
MNILTCLRWFALLPTLVVAYLFAWGVPTVIAIPFIQNMVIADTPGTYEITSHFFWDWIIHPIVTVFIGAIAVEGTTKAASFVAPSYKNQTVQLVCGMLVLLALINLVMVLRASLANIHGILYNISLGVCACYLVFSQRSNEGREINNA